MTKCLENFVPQALGLFTRFYAAELRLYLYKKILLQYGLFRISIRAVFREKI